MTTLEAIGLLISFQESSKKLIQNNENAKNVFWNIVENPPKYEGNEFNTSDGRRVFIKQCGTIDTTVSNDQGGIVLNIISYNDEGIVDRFEHYYIGAKRKECGLATFLDFSQLVITREISTLKEGELTKVSDNIFASDIPNIEIYPR